MTRQTFLAVLTLVPALTLAPAAGQAATIQTTLPAWTAALGGAPYVTTSVVDPAVNFVNDGAVPVSAFTLANGTGVALSGAGDYVYISGFQGPQYGDGYAGQLVDSTNGTETLTFSRPVSAFGFTLKPDDAGLPPTTDTLAITLSDGTAQTVSASFGLSTVQFLGFTGAPQTSVTITTGSGNDVFFGEFVTPVPEPATLGLLFAGMVGIGLARRRAAR